MQKANIKLTFGCGGDVIVPLLAILRLRQILEVTQLAKGSEPNSFCPVVPLVHFQTNIG